MVVQAICDAPNLAELRGFNLKPTSEASYYQSFKLRYTYSPTDRRSQTFEWTKICQKSDFNFLYFFLRSSRNHGAMTTRWTRQFKGHPLHSEMASAIYFCFSPFDRKYLHYEAQSDQNTKCYTNFRAISSTNAVLGKYRYHFPQVGTIDDIQWLATDCRMQVYMTRKQKVKWILVP